MEFASSRSNKLTLLNSSLGQLALNIRLVTGTMVLMAVGVMLIIINIANFTIIISHQMHYNQHLYHYHRRYKG